MPPLAEGVRAGDPRSISRAISAAENGTPEGRAVLDAVAPWTGRARRVGFTGPPGVGKSTTIDALIGVLRARGDKVGIVSVDPTSPFTGGALLGDRVRMAKLLEDPGVFMRSMASRGSMGGISRATQDAADLLDAAGMGWILIETVGVGQSDVDIARATDATVVILSPESGDGIQAMKSGLMEIADVLLINKADRTGADKLAHDLQSAFQLRQAGRTDVPILLAEAWKGKGVPELLAGIESWIAACEKDGRFAARRALNARNRLRELVEFMIHRDLWANPTSESRLESLAAEVLAHSRSSYQAAELLLREAMKTK